MTTQCTIGSAFSNRLTPTTAIHPSVHLVTRLIAEKPAVAVEVITVTGDLVNITSIDHGDVVLLAASFKKNRHVFEHWQGKQSGNNDTNEYQLNQGPP